MTARLTDDEKDRIVQLGADGHGVRDISRAMGYAPSTISRVLKEHGLNTATPEGQAQTLKARAKRLESIKQRRLELAEMLINDAFTMRARMHAPHHYYERGPEGLVLVEEPLPPIREQKAGYETIAKQLEAHDKLMAIVGDNTETDRNSVMVTLLNHFRGAAQTMKNDDEQGE